MHLYFAYGSNMDAAQMRERCPEAELLGPAELAGYTLGFTIYSPKRTCGCADVIRKEDGTVYGLLYRLTDADLEKMDGFEGHPIHYRRITVPILFAGKEVLAETYEVVRKESYVQTSPAYLDLLRNAAKLHSFPEDYRALLDSFAPE